MPLSPARSPRALSALIPMLVLGLGLLGCGDNSTPSMPQVPPMTTTPPTTPTTPTPPPDPEPTTPDQPEEATYDIQYAALISSIDALVLLGGATAYPDGVEAAEGLVMAEHPRDITLWERGGMASAGLKMLAETGDPTMAIAEAEAMGMTVRWRDGASVQALLQGQEITLNYQNSCVTYAQGIVPSPDWFVGFTVCATDEETGEWMETVELTAIAWDAGTDDGDDYMAEDMPSDPQMPISPLDKAPFSPAETPVSVITATLRQGS